MGNEALAVQSTDATPPLEVPGIYADIPNEVYHAGPGVSSSAVKLVVRRSLAHYAAHYITKKATKKETEAMGFGTAYHHFVLEPGTFLTHFVQELSPADYPDALNTADQLRARLKALGQKCPKSKAEMIAAVKEADPNVLIWDDLLEKHQHLHSTKTLLSARDMERINVMGAKLRAHPTAGLILSEGMAERSMYWIDRDTGVLCKIRPDWEREGMVLADLKTTEDASPEAFARTIHRFGYHISAAMYLDGYKEVTGHDLGGNFTFIVQETEPPYEVACYVIDDESIAQGRREYKLGLEQIAEAQRTGDWTGYGAKLMPISLPRWAMK